MVYLELAACRLSSLPAEFARLVPNVRVLNLNYNFLEETRALEGLTRLRKLTMIGSRIKGTKLLVRVLREMRDIEMLDFRYVDFLSSPRSGVCDENGGLRCFFFPSIACFCGALCPPVLRWRGRQQQSRRCAGCVLRLCAVTD